MTKQELQVIFQSKLTKLSTRAKNILEDQGLLLFDFFYEYYFIKESKIIFKFCRNCGSKTANELDEFISDICNFRVTELFFDKPFILRPQLLQKNPRTLPIFNFKTKLVFEIKFNKLSVRTKNILTGLNSNFIDGFYIETFFDDSQSILLLRNCGKSTTLEILKFKLIVNDLIKKYNINLELNNSFNDIEFYLTNTKCFRDIELDIFNNYYCFTQNESKETLLEIANRYHLSKERVRQIAVSLLKGIREIVLILNKKYKLNFHKYFHDEYFIVNQDYATKINQEEKTHFSSQFIAYILSLVCNPEFEFFLTCENQLFIDTLFIKETIPFDSNRCFKYLKFNAASKDNVSKKIRTDELLNSFRKKNIIDFYERTQILNIIQILINFINGEESKIIIEDDFIIFRNRSHQYLYELFVDILNEYKQPMHFTDIYKECIKKGYLIKSEASVHSTLIRRNDIFGLKGPGIYGLTEWGGYFGTIGDVAAKILEERNKPILKRELEDILCRELYISKDSISVVLFGYELEDRFLKNKDDTISLRKWK